MQYKSMMALGAILFLAGGVNSPALAKDKDDDRGAGKPAKIHVVITTGDEKEETRLYQRWCGAPTEQYDAVDPVTGERLADLAQVVVEVTRDRVVLRDGQNNRRGVLVTSRTLITFERREMAAGGDRRLQSPTTSIRSGDRVVVEGYLRANGEMVATRLRVLERMNGWGDDDEEVGYGYRSWGDVRAVDERAGTIELNGNLGRVRLTLDRGGELLVNGKRESLSYLRRGDRLVVYCRERAVGVGVAYRVVLLVANEPYPQGDRPYWTDPDVRVDGNQLEGRVLSLEQGAIFTKLLLFVDGRTVLVRCPKVLQAIDRDGTRMPLTELRERDRVRITVVDGDGLYFAKRVAVVN